MGRYKQFCLFRVRGRLQLNFAVARLFARGSSEHRISLPWDFRSLRSPSADREFPYARVLHLEHRDLAIEEIIC